MASGSYSDYGAKKVILPEPEQMSIPLRARATQQLPALKEPEVKETRPLPIKRPPRVVNEFEEHPLTRHVPWLRTFYVSMIVIIIAAFVLISAGWFQRPGVPQLVISSNAQVFPIQVGGTLGAVNAWANSNGPADPKTPIPTNPGPYSVVGPNSLSVGFMNQVLAYYHSPAAGKAQALYDEGVKYGLDSAYALAFFMHESSFGVTLSLSNMRCVPQFPCLNENGGYAIFKSWEQGFEEWFKLIRNLYVAIWGRVTVDQIIPKYAPNSDGNNEAGYIATLKHTISTWRAGIIPA